MVRRLTADKPWAQLDTLEIDRGGASYTVDTLARCTGAARPTSSDHRNGYAALVR